MKSTDASLDAWLDLLHDYVRLGRDVEWAQAMAHALGAGSGYSVPLVLDPDAFRRLFDAVRARSAEVAEAHRPNDPKTGPQGERKP
jgi:dihydrodipicolinate synthase/N-acetylneuraminate lyase